MRPAELCCLHHDEAREVLDAVAPGDPLHEDGPRRCDARGRLVRRHAFVATDGQRQEGSWLATDRFGDQALAPVRITIRASPRLALEGDADEIVALVLDDAALTAVSHRCTDVENAAPSALVGMVVFFLFQSALPFLCG